MALVQIEQHLEEAITGLAPPWWGKPRIASLVKSFIDQVQALEDELWDVIVERELETADLERLKVLGKIIGQPRLTFDEETYRTVLKARALANVSQGRASDILAVLELLFGTGNYTLTEVGNATLLISAGEPLTGIEAAEAVLPDVRAAGVGFQLLFSDSADVFRWGDTWGSPEGWGTVRVL